MVCHIFIEETNKTLLTNFKKKEKYVKNNKALERFELLFCTSKLAVLTICTGPSWSACTLCYKA